MSRILLALILAVGIPAAALAQRSPGVAGPVAAWPKYQLVNGQLWVYYENHLLDVFQPDGLGGWQFLYRTAW